MRLSRDHVAKVTRQMPDPGIHLLPGFVPATDADYDRVVAEIIAGAPNDGFWVFAYGSLIWNPDFDFTEQRKAVARGWRRRFCLGWDYRWRGNREQPGLMLALDRGGQCNGVIFRLPDAAIEANMHRLIRREMSMVPSAFPPRWIQVETPEGPLKALTFAMNRNSGRYIGTLDDEATADVLATACGFRGSMAEYLHATVSHLDMLGIRDRHLWRLQEMVAERLEREMPVSS
ncbi:gamma-glutamylcyclotransferase [Mesorhizobium sp. J428]|uniref:gamma-glutamylcyclotransferase n=1 Tax=Mesorhizobium sp. J428 TaxID=2898440 RepID=UPI0021519EB4|nr:gamma-glutamylcyclotransferase [Mesorhizobium sp. J428]MCR5856466.1 gamma-glutamylcyclotransferase [Mesorhizobium sp. J428]